MLHDQPLVDYKREKSKHVDKNAWKERKAAAWKVLEAEQKYKEKDEIVKNGTPFKLNLKDYKVTKPKTDNNE